MTSTRQIALNQGNFGLAMASVPYWFAEPIGGERFLACSAALLWYAPSPVAHRTRGVMTLVQRLHRVLQSRSELPSQRWRMSSNLTEDNDINQLTGRPNGYVAASALVDSRVECATAEPGVDCGATVEQWPDEGAAHKRADYIQETLPSMPMLGNEWTTVNGNLLLRVTGKLKPSAAKAYEASFAG
jgi:hypothetical protein